MTKKLFSQRKSFKVRNKTFFMYLMIFLFLPAISFAQSKVTGTVKDNNGKSLSNVSVVVKNTSTGTTTDESGKFSISAQPADVLVFSFTGFESKEIKVNNQNNLTVSLNTKANSLNEVVVVGYGRVKKKDLTGSVAVVNVESMNKVPTGSIENQLQGQAAGVSIISSGQPGEEPQIIIRGVNTFGDKDRKSVV